MRPATPASAADHVDEQFDAVDGYPGQTGRLLIASDRYDLPPEHRVADCRPGDRGDRNHQDHLGGNAGDTSQGDELEPFVPEDLQVAVGHHLGDAAACDEQHEGRDDRLDGETGHEQTVEKTEQPRGDDRQNEGQRHGDGHGGDRKQRPHEDHRRKRAADRHQ
jgi:hypothetical protein